MENNKTKREAAGLVIIVFVLGVLLGGVGNHVWGDRVWGRGITAPGQSPNRDNLIKDLTRTLALTQDQQNQLGAIVDETRAKWVALEVSVQPEHERIRLDGRGRIRAILTPDQQKKFEVFLQQLDEKRKKAQEH
jgi:hypothetical protein